MSARLVVLSALFLTQIGMSDPWTGGPLDVVLSSEILSAKDNRTGDNYVQKGNKVRVQSRVWVEIRGFAGGSLRDALESRLPLKVRGFYEREDRDSGLVTRYKPVTFALDARSLRCRRDDSPEFRLCTAEYTVSRTNTVDVPAGDGGEHVVALQMLPPSKSEFPIHMNRGSSRTYTVVTGRPQLTQFHFKGLPQH